MYLSKLELHGFKSFADRTVVDFADGVTVVVGPNGCGKSNIVDAVRWVIGEQRARILRSDKMDSVIFNGTSKRRPLGMSEVMLTIENTRGILPTEYSEVTIGRRLFRSGESEYLLNGVNCRLRDITDLFMDTGMGAGAYSVIELKMIEEILSDNAADRRHLFEEAAGITKYKIRRGQTLRKLKSTQGDLDRVRDLREELDKRVRSLERQAQKAARFKRYESRLHELEVALGVLEYQKLITDLAAVNQDIGQYSDAAAGFSAKLSAEEASHESLRSDHVTREKRVSEAQTALSDHVDRMRASEADLRVATERLSTISRDLTRLDEEAQAAVGQKERLAEDLTRIEGEVTDVAPAAERAEKELSDAKRIRDEAQLTQQKHQVLLHNVRLQERQSLSEKGEKQRQIDRLSSRIEITEADLVSAQESLEHHFQSGTDLVARKQSVDAALATARERATAAQQALTELEQQKAQKEDAISAHQHVLRQAQRVFDQAESEVQLLQAILHSFDDLEESVQYLAGESGWTAGELLTLADVVACDDQYKLAVNAAMGDLSSCIVVPSSDDAARAVQQLRAADKGRATFLILDRLSPVNSAKAPVGFTSLGDLVRVDDASLESLVQVVFGGCFLADSLDNLGDSLPGRVFNQAGEWLDPQGYWFAGSEASEEGQTYSRIGRREQLVEAKSALETASTDLESAEKQDTTLRSELASLDLMAARETANSARAELLEAEKAQSRVAAEADLSSGRETELQTRISTLTTSLAEANELIDSASQAVKDLTVQVADLQRKRADAEAAFEGIEEASRKAYGLFNEANITAVQTRNRLDNLKREQARITEDLASLDRRAGERSQAIDSLIKQRAELQERCAELQSSIKEMQDGRLALDEAVTKAKEGLMETKVAISELESRLRDIRRDRENAMRSESDRAIRKAELETRLEDLTTSFLEDFEMDLAATDAEIPEDFDKTAARDEVHTLKNRIRHLGPVNALALESFEEEKERLEFMNVQLADLEQAEATLRTTIDEINTTASERFATTFTAIQENFRKLFEELFGDGASADISLTDGADPLESDVEIFAKPRGKKPSVLSQLSGGEKTLTAIALLFAIYLVKPSPFCILDEVDAPLDDANVDRFMHLIRTFSDSTQFILVTHNKRTMEAADRMYGITMQEQGVSRLVGVKFEKEDEPAEAEAV